METGNNLLQQFYQLLRHSQSFRNSNAQRNIEYAHGCQAARWPWKSCVLCARQRKFRNRVFPVKGKNPRHLTKKNGIRTQVKFNLILLYFI